MHHYIQTIYTGNFVSVRVDRNRRLRPVLLDVDVCMDARRTARVLLELRALRDEVDQAIIATEAYEREEAERRDARMDAVAAECFLGPKAGSVFVVLKRDDLSINLYRVFTTREAAEDFVKHAQLAVDAGAVAPPSLREFEIVEMPVIQKTNSVHKEAERHDAATDGAPSDETPAVQSYVSREGVLKLPQSVMASLDLPHGGGVVFDVDENGRVEILSNTKFVERYNLPS